MKIEIFVGTGVSYIKLERDNGSVAMVTLSDFDEKGEEWGSAGSDREELAALKRMLTSALDIALDANDGN